MFPCGENLGFAGYPVFLGVPCGEILVLRKAPTGA